MGKKDILLPVIISTGLLFSSCASIPQEGSVNLTQPLSGVSTANKACTIIP